MTSVLVFYVLVALLLNDSMVKPPKASSRFLLLGQITKSCKITNVLCSQLSCL